MPRRGTVRNEPEQLLGERVQFRATDGVRLSGVKIGGHTERPWIILCHGLASNSDDMRGLATMLHASQFNVFFFDFRAHGGSAGRTTSFGWQERCDLEGALAFLGQQADVPARPYGIFGISMGAAVALMLAGSDERLGAIIADSPYGSLAEALVRHLRLRYPLIPPVPFGWFVWSAYRLRFRVWPQAIAPRRSVAGIGPRPLLVIYGDQDPQIVPSSINALVEGRDRESLWIIPEAGHPEHCRVGTASYPERIRSFFEEWLYGNR